MEHEDEEDEEEAELAAAEEAELEQDEDEDDVEGALDLEDGAAGEVRGRSILLLLVCCKQHLVWKMKSG